MTGSCSICGSSSNGSASWLRAIYESEISSKIVGYVCQACDRETEEEEEYDRADAQEG